MFLTAIIAKAGVKYSISNTFSHTGYFGFGGIVPGTMIKFLVELLLIAHHGFLYSPGNP